LGLSEGTVRNYLSDAIGKWAAATAPTPHASRATAAGFEASFAHHTSLRSARIVVTEPLVFADDLAASSERRVDERGEGAVALLAEVGVDLSLTNFESILVDPLAKRMFFPVIRRLHRFSRGARHGHQR